jgi:hypothetical protein
MHILCKLAERVEAYASSNNTIISVVVIEALNTFLRELKNRIG